MRKLFGILSVGAVAAFLYAQSGSGTLTNFAKTLNGATSVSANYTFQQIGGGKTEFTVELAKPNKARIDKPGELIVADGKTITTYNKAEKAYFARPQTDADVAGLFSSDELGVWASFFNGNAFANTPSKALGTKNRKNMTLSVVEFAADKTGKKKITLYVSPDNLARQAEILLDDPNGRVTYVLDTKSVTLNGAPTDAFAFKAPEGSRKLTEDEMIGSKWFTDLDEAMKVAARTNRKIFVDFMAVWCGPCKLLERDVLNTDEFKKMSKYVVFLRIDVDQQPSVSQRYAVEAMPTQMILAADGAVLSKTVGYGSPAGFYSWFNGAIGK